MRQPADPGTPRIACSSAADGRVEGVANFAAGGLDLADAEVQLLAGDIGRKVSAPMAREMTMARAADAYASGAPENEAVG